MRQELLATGAGRVVVTMGATVDVGVVDVGVVVVAAVVDGVVVLAVVLVTSGAPLGRWP
jgi:hypothetical protein